MKRIAVVVALLAALIGTDAQAEVRFANTANRPTFDEWAAYSCENTTRFSQTAPFHHPSDPQRYYWINLYDGDDSYGERCELSMGNTSASAIRRVGGPRAVFHRGDDLWIGTKFRLMPTFAFAPDGAPVPVKNEGGLIVQVKQMGSCGTPALGIVAARDVMHVRNSAGNGCESGPMRTITTWPTVVNQTVRVLQRIIFHTDPSIGYIETWVDIGDGAGMVLRGAVHTHTQKSPTDNQAGVCDAPDVCSHGRVGIYRDPDIQGRSIIRHDQFVAATTRPEAEAVLYAP